MLNALLQMYPLLIVLDSSARTSTMRPSRTSTRMPQLWLQRTHTVGRSVPSDGTPARVGWSLMLAPSRSTGGCMSACRVGISLRRTRRHVARGHGVAAVLAREPQRGDVPAAAVHALERRPVLAGHVLVAPAGHRDDDAVEVMPLLGQAVLEARG